MAYPNSNVLNIIIPQTSASVDPINSQAPFVERIISGSRLILQTDNTGTLIGSSDINVNSITASNISASGYISSSNLYVKTNITDAGTLNVVGATTLAGLTGTTATFTGLVSASAGLTASAIQDAGTLTVVGSTTLAGLTATTATFSGLVSASAGLTASAIQDAGTLTVVGATTLAGLTATTATFSGLVSASAGLTASAIQDAGTLTVVGNSTLSNVFATNITASNISASGNITSSNEYIAGTLTVVGNSTLSNVFATNITASNISASNKIVASEITASSEMFVGTGRALRTAGEAYTPENLARLYVSGSVSVVSKYATLNLATSASDSGAQSNILFSRISEVTASGGAIETALQPRWQIGTESGSNDLRLYAYYVSSDPDNVANGSTGANIAAGARVVMKQNGYFGVGSFYNYGGGGGAKTTYQSSLPGYTVADNLVPYYGPDALLTLLPMDSGSAGTAASKAFNRNILNIMSYDTSSIMFISGSDGYVLLGKNTTDGINRLQIVGNVSASGYTGSLFGTSSWSINSINSLTASTILVTDTSTGTGPYYVTFVDGTSGAKTLRTDSSTLTWNSTTNTLSSSGNFVANSFTSSNGIQFTSNNATISPVATNVIGNNLILASGNSGVGGGSAGGNLYLYSGNSGDVAGDIYITPGTASVGASTGSVYINGGGLTVGVNSPVVINNATQATNYDVAALEIVGGVGIGKNLYVSGSTWLYGDLNIFGSSSVTNISSSTVIINDNIIQLNAYVPFERYAGFEVYDSGSNQRSASLLWDGQADNWITVDQNNTSSNIILGPTASFGNVPGSLTTNNIPKAYDATGITPSLLSDDGTNLSYTGTTISSSKLLATTGSITYITGALVTYVTGSFTTITIATGSNPGAGAVPVHPTASGMPGQINVDNNFIYVYTNNIWKRVPISNWSL